MKKVIIVTRTNEYGSYKEFQDAIDARENCKYNDNDKLFRFLTARKIWNDAFLDNEGDIVDTFESVLGKECEAFGEEELANVHFDAIKELMTSINDVKPYKPYASFYYPNEQSPEWEVILVFYDCINIMRRECVQPEDLYLDCVCDNLRLSESTENILYVHADQIGFHEDGVIVENHVLKKPNNGNRAIIWADTNKSRFYRIAFFVHEPMNNGIFKRNILEKDFDGRTIMDDVLDAQNDFFNRVDDL